jgi:hypothetical protein
MALNVLGCSLLNTLFFIRSACSLRSLASSYRLRRFSVKARLPILMSVCGCSAPSTPSPRPPHPTLIPLSPISASYRIRQPPNLLKSFERSAMLEVHAGLSIDTLSPVRLMAKLNGLTGTGDIKRNAFFSFFCNHAWSYQTLCLCLIQSFRHSSP